MEMCFGMHRRIYRSGAPRCSWSCSSKTVHIVTSHGYLSQMVHWFGIEAVSQRHCHASRHGTDTLPPTKERNTKSAPAKSMRRWLHVLCNVVFSARVAQDQIAAAASSERRCPISVTASTINNEAHNEFGDDTVEGLSNGFDAKLFMRLGEADAYGGEVHATLPGVTWKNETTGNTYNSFTGSARACSDVEKWCWYFSLNTTPTVPCECIQRRISWCVGTCLAPPRLL